MRFRGRNRMHSEPQTHSFNDIMFFLMFFFLIVATLANPSAIKILLPKAKGEKIVARKPIELYIDASLNYYIDKNMVPIDQLEAQLKTRVDAAKAANPNEDPLVKLYVDRTITIQTVAEVMDMGNRLNIKILLALQPH
jgi:biopolymer transport protein ExbD